MSGELLIGMQRGKKEFEYGSKKMGWLVADKQHRQAKMPAAGATQALRAFSDPLSGYNKLACKIKQAAIVASTSKRKLLSMNKPKYKLGYSDSGGIFIGKNIQSEFHMNHLIAIVISFTKKFTVIQKAKKPIVCEAAFIPNEVLYKLSTDATDFVAFVHIDPYSEIGIALKRISQDIQILGRDVFLEELCEIKRWYKGSDNSSKKTDLLLRKITRVVKTYNSSSVKIDNRVLQCIKILIKTDGNSTNLKLISEQVFLSPSRLAHIIKKETGLTFRQFVQHYKLVKSLKAIHSNSNLTEASIIGGFSDQPHFSKTFKKSFGIKPSSSKL